MGKIVAVVVAIVLILVAIGAWLLLSQPPPPPPAQNQPPSITSVTADRVTAGVGVSVAFTATATDPDAGDTLTYNWTFGDGTTGTGPTITHPYTTGGSFIATVAVDDGHGHVVTSATTANQLLFVGIDHPETRAPSSPSGSPNPVAILTASKNLIQVNDTVQFDGNSTWTWAWNGNATEGSWQQELAGGSGTTNTTAIPTLSFDFGDGTAPLSGNATALWPVSHKFATAGVRAVKLTATNYKGNTDVVGYTIIVSAVAPPTPGVKNPDIFTEATFGEPESLDPAFDYETSGGQVIQNVAEGLIWYNGAAADVFKPVLAAKVPDLSNPADVSPDGLIWNLTLRPNVHFQYGTDTVDCNAVKFSFTRELTLNDPQSPTWIYDQSLTNYATVNRTQIIDGAIQCPDGLTGLKVQFHLAVPYPAFLATLAFTGAFIIDPNSAAYHASARCYYDANSNGRLDTGEGPDLVRSYCHDQIVGTGPFKLRAWQPNQQIILDANPNYWNAGTGAGQKLVPFKEVHIVKANDVATRVLMLKAGDADYIALPVNHKNDIRDTGGNLVSGVTEQSGNTFNVAFIGLNQNINVSAAPVGDFNVPSTFFADVNVRRAFAAAWKYTDFINNVLYGYGTKLCSAIPAGMFGYDATAPCYDYDLTQAQYWLQRALDTRTGNPTDTYWDNGFTLTVYYNIGNTVREEGARQLATTFQALNALRPGLPPFTVKAQGLEWASFLSYVNQKIPSLFFLGWAPDYADPDDYVLPFLHTGQFYPDRVGYSNTTLDALIDQQSRELNVTQRENLLAQIQRAPYYDVPYIWEYQGKAYQVMRTWVHGFYENPMTTAGTGNYYYDYTKS